MARCHMFGLPVILIAILVCSVYCEVRKFPFLMPNLYPDRDEFYACTPVRIVDGKSFYIVGFEPNASMNVAHHMLLFGCKAPGSSDTVWDCGEMATSSSSSNLKKADPCSEGSHVVYAWARNAKSLELPEDVGFQVGKGTEIQYLVLQVHYSKKFPEGKTDNSGVFLLYTEQRQSKLAGVLLFGVGGVIPQRSITKMETACQLNEMKVIHPFAYRTHTHTLGRVVSGYVVRRDEYEVDHWTLLGRRDPLTPQMFYAVFNKEPITYGDRIAARCTMDSHNKNKDTYIGPTNNDEMCNFYLMYYVENDTPLKMQYCTTGGPSVYQWSKEFNNIPDLEASSLP